MDSTRNSGIGSALVPSATQRHPTDIPDRYMSVDGLSATLTRMELGLIRLYEAFSSWALELQKFVSDDPMTFQEVSLLHCVRLRGGTTSLAEMMIFLHRHDLAAINYSLRKLEKNGLIRRLRGKYRREVAYAITDLGKGVTESYAQLRQQVLLHLCREVVDFQASGNDACAAMERMIGIYDQATQSILTRSLIATDPCAAQTPASVQTAEPPPPVKPGNAQPARSRLRHR
jgi:predicted MarR family transcription regulator